MDIKKLITKAEEIAKLKQDMDVYYTKREPVIMELRQKGFSLEEIGGIFGLTRERIRQILFKK